MFSVRNWLNCSIVLMTVFVGLMDAGLCAEPPEVDSSEVLSHSPESWTTGGPRVDAMPEFRFDATGGPNGSGALVTVADHREGLHGWWQTTLPVKGGQHYQFHALRRAVGAEYPRRSAVARIFWQDAQGRAVRHDHPAETTYREGERPVSEPEYPPDGPEQFDGWTEVNGVFRVPSEAVQARLELSFRWAPNAEIHWSEISLQPVNPPESRRVRLAAVHFAPVDGTTNEEKCRQFEPLIEKAASRGADLVVLPETLTYFNAGRSLSDCAESIPGPSTDYFGTLARKNDLYIVAGLVERESHRIFNVAVLIGPDGKVCGKYRKVALPRTEIDAGVEAGNDYPVFDTRIGKIGMMVCYDGFFPEVARELSNRGADIIAFPVWGCNPLLASARACENHVFVVSSTYTDVSSNWMITAVFGRDGRPLAKAEQWGDVVMAEVEPGRPAIWHSLGDFHAEVLRHRPPVRPAVP